MEPKEFIEKYESDLVKLEDFKTKVEDILWSQAERIKALEEAVSEPPQPSSGSGDDEVTTESKSEDEGEVKTESEDEGEVKTESEDEGEVKTESEDEDEVKTESEDEDEDKEEPLKPQTESAKGNRPVDNSEPLVETSANSKLAESVGQTLNAYFS